MSKSTTPTADSLFDIFSGDAARILSLTERVEELEKLAIPKGTVLINCNQVGCMNGEFAYPSSKGLCPKCGGTGKLLRLKH